MLALLIATAALALPCDEAAIDGDVLWAGLKHDSFEAAYRAPFGAVPAGSGSVILRLRTCTDDLTGARVRVWDEVAASEVWSEMTLEEDGEEPDVGPMSFWELELPVPSSAGRLFYLFEASDGSAVVGYQDDDTVRYCGGTGEPVSELDLSMSYQLTVYDGDAHWPDWARGALIYQILPDRFRNGDPGNDPSDSWLYGYPAVSLAWDAGLDSVEQCVGGDTERAVCFYGGDLQGIIDELDHVAGLGVDALYLNPIFTAPTNHRYDPQDLHGVDPDLGDLGTFQDLVAACDALGIRIILDGVFNHVSADSRYFDHYARWDAHGSLTSPDGPGMSDGSGACESGDSPWREAFVFDPDAHVAHYNDGETAWCPRDDPSGSTYQGWAGYYHIPKLDADSEVVQRLVYADGVDSAGPYWIEQGAAGWRLDVAPEMDGGTGAANDNEFWESFRAALRAVDSDAVVVGERWDDATQGLLGDEWDGVMDYRFQAAVVDWVFGGCSGEGCVPCSELNCDGMAFHDAQHHPGRDMGEVNRIGPGLLRARLLGILEDYPEPTWTRSWNLLGSHDVNRIAWLLAKISDDDAELAQRKLAFLTLFQHAWPGCPTVYYGDEVGVAAAAQWDGTHWVADPWNRVAFPWADQGLEPDMDLYAQLATYGALHHDHPVLARGGVQILDWDDEADLFAFARTDGDEPGAVAVFNRRWLGGEGSQDVTLGVEGALDEGSCWVDALEGGESTVIDGALTVPGVSDLGAAVLVPCEASDTDTPDSPADSEAPTDSGAPSDSGEPGEKDCGCGGGGVAGVLGLLLAPLLLWRRRVRARVNCAPTLGDRPL